MGFDRYCSRFFDAAAVVAVVAATPLLVVLQCSEKPRTRSRYRTRTEPSYRSLEFTLNLTEP